MKYQPEEVAKCLASHEGIDSDGIETAFDVSYIPFVHVYLSECVLALCVCVCGGGGGR